MRVRLIALDCAHHGQRLLRGGGAVQINEWLAVDVARENGEITAHTLGIKRLFGHGISCACDAHRRSFKSAATSMLPARASSIVLLSSGISDLADDVGKKCPFQELLC